MQIAILLYDRFTALDAVGPYEVLSRLPDARVIFTAERAGPVTAGTGMLTLVAEAAIADVGLLSGRKATSHWLALDQLPGYGTEPVSKRVVMDGKYITAAGVSAGIDMALELAGRIAGDPAACAIQLMIEYDPQPPYQAGSPDKAPADLVTGLRSRSRHAVSSK